VPWPIRSSFISLVKSEKKSDTGVLFIFYPKYSFTHWFINDNYLVKSALFSQIFSKWNKLSFIIFANKYDKIQCWLRNFDNFQEISNSVISLLRIFIYSWSIWKKYLLLGFSFAYFESHQSYFQFFSGFEVLGQ
jgi:hypothetical protein